MLFNRVISLGLPLGVMVARPPRFLEDLCIGDESAFCLNGSISTQGPVRKHTPHGQKPLDFAFETRDAKQKLTV